MGILWILSLLLYVNYTDAGMFLNNPGTVTVPYVYAMDYTVWSNINATCEITRTEHRQACYHNGWTLNCTTISYTVNETGPCDRCEITTNPYDMFYENDLSIIKKSCATADCSGRCPNDDCLPVGVTVTVGVRCWSTADWSNQNVTTTFSVTSVDNSSLSNCPILTVPAGILSSADTRPCNTVWVSCIDGHSLIGGPHVTCCGNTWVPLPPSCTKDCMTLTVANGRISTNETTHGARVTLTCNEGYTLSGRPTITCSHGTWSDETPTCHAECKIPTIPHGRLISNYPAHGTQASVICDTGYSLAEILPLTCLDGNWIGMIPVCHKDCHVLSIPNGRLSSDLSLHGVQVRITCNGGYLLSGSSILTCENGIWSENMPDCEKECSNNTFGVNCEFNCDCIANNTANPRQSCDPHSGKCRCLPAWKGARCSEDVDECGTGSHNCDVKNSLCQNTPGGFRCASKEIFGSLDQTKEKGDDLVLPLSVGVVIFCSVSTVLLALLFWRRIKHKWLGSKEDGQISYVDLDVLEDKDSRSRHASGASSADSGYSEKSCKNTSQPDDNKTVKFHEPNNGIAMESKEVDWNKEDLTYL